MMLDQAQKLLERVSYKSGWVFQLRLTESDVVRLCLHHRTVCSETGGAIEVLHEHRLSLIELGVLSSVGLLEVLQERVIQAERHEIDEWLRLDGRPLHRPHEGLGPLGVLQAGGEDVEHRLG